MKRRERVLTGRLISEHIVQLFDCHESRIGGVAAFVREGLACGAPVLVVAKPQHWVAIEEDLEASGVDVTAAMADRRVTVLDASSVLAALMRAERPDPTRFREQVGTLVAQLAPAEATPLYVYGEMVDLLAETGDYRAAAELEELWNDLVREHAVRLLCGYCSAHFGPEPTSSVLHAICRSHTEVRTTPDDPLGAWLTGTAWPTLAPRS